MDERQRHTLTTDLEIFQRALRLRAPIFVGENFDGAKRVGFGAGGCHVHFLRKRSRLTTVGSLGGASVGSAGASGPDLAWGAAGFLTFPHNHIAYQTMLALFVTGICAGGLINYSIDKLTAALFTAGAFSLIIPAYLSEQNTILKVVAIMMLIFIAYVAVACKKLAAGILSNITLRIEAENQQKQIAQLSERQNFHLAHTTLGLIDWDANLTITAWNKACTDILGYSVEEAIGMHISFIMPDMINKPAAHIMHAMTATNNNASLREIVHKDGNKVYCEWFNTPLKNEAGELIGIATLVQDKTDFIADQEKIYQLAYYDSLTNLPNRGLLIDRINQTLAASKRKKTYSLIAFIDLDHFKAINDVKGHDAGDLLLKTIANRLQNNIRQQDTAARLGGDEFVLVLSDIGCTQQEAEDYGKAIIEKISKAIHAPINFEDYQHQCSASIGVSLFNDDSLDANELLRRADVAMYLSKKQARNAYQFYDDAQLPKYEYTLKLKHDLNHALANISGGRRPTRIEMKMMLSTPSTISSAVNVARATQALGSAIQSNIVTPCRGPRPR